MAPFIGPLLYCLTLLYTSAGKPQLELETAQPERFNTSMIVMYLCTFSLLEYQYAKPLWTQKAFKLVDQEMINLRKATNSFK